MKNQYGKFTIICPAGSGGFGAIYAVVREGDSKAYILKTLKKVDPTTREIELFKKEIDIIFYIIMIKIIFLHHYLILLLIFIQKEIYIFI